MRTTVQTATEIRPFHVDIAEEAIDDLRRRIQAWRPPEREPVDDQSQGVQLATVQSLANYWATEYDWRPCEAKLNALDQFVTTIDGLDIHFIHVRSPHENALPLIVSHGWPGSIIEQLKIIEPLSSASERPTGERQSALWPSAGQHMESGGFAPGSLSSGPGGPRLGDGPDGRPTCRSPRSCWSTEPGPTRAAGTPSPPI